MAILVQSKSGRLLAQDKTFAEVVASPDTTGKTIIVTSPTEVPYNLTIPYGSNVRCEFGGQLLIASGKTLNLQGNFSAGDYFCLGGEGTVKIGGSNGLISNYQPQIYANWFRDPNHADDTIAINKALASSIVGTVLITKDMAVSDVINNTNGYRSLIGFTPLIAINSSSSTYIMDNTGMQYGTIKNITFNAVASVAAPCGPEIGLYFNRSTTFDFSVFITLQDLTVNMLSNPQYLENGDTEGTCAYYNRAAENHRTSGCFFLADIPMVILSDANAGILPVVPGVTEGGASSATDMIHDLIGLATHSVSTPALKTLNVANIHFRSGYIQSRSNTPALAGVYANPIQIIGDLVQSSMEFQIENYHKGAIVQDCSIGNRFDFYFEHPMPDGAIELERITTDMPNALTIFLNNDVSVFGGGSDDPASSAVKSTRTLDTADSALNRLDVRANRIDYAGSIGKALNITSLTSKITNRLFYNRTPGTIPGGVTDTWVFGALALDTTSIDIPWEPGLISLVVESKYYGKAAGSDGEVVRFHVLYALDGTPEAPIKEVISKVGTGNNIDISLVSGNTVRISGSGQIVEGTMIHHVKAYVMAVTK